MAATEMGKRSPASPASLQAELDAARRRQAELEAGEAAAEQESDEAFAAWLRQKRLADREVSRLVEAKAQAERDADAEKAKARLAEYDARYQARAAGNSDVERMLKDDLRAACSTILRVMEAAALAEIETAAVIHAMPRDYEPTVWIGDPDRTVRCRPPEMEEIVSDKVIELWVDPDTGHIFADQDQKSHRAVKKAFREVKYHIFRPAGETPKFFRGLRIPRLDAFGDDCFFDGSKLHDAHDVLAAIREVRNRPGPRPRPVITELKPVEKAAVVAVDDLPPPISS